MVSKGNNWDLSKGFNDINKEKTSVTLRIRGLFIFYSIQTLIRKKHYLVNIFWYHYPILITF